MKWYTRVVLIFFSALCGLALAYVTGPKRSNVAIQDNSSVESEAGNITFELDDDDYASGIRINSPFGKDPGERKAIASMIESTLSYSEDVWMRSFEMVERSGQSVSSVSLLGEPYIACFFFTRCPGSCKKQSDEMRLLQQKYRDLPVRLMSITVDPVVDTPEVLSQYASELGADKQKWLFLTSEMDYIQKVAAEIFFLGLVRERAHPDRFCLVDQSGTLVGRYDWREASELEELDRHLRELLENEKTEPAQ